MLIMTRRPGEAICIRDDIEVTVLGVKGNQVRIGVNAPNNVQVDRAEIRERKNTEAARLQHLYVFDCHFIRGNLQNIHTQIAAESERDMRAHLCNLFPDIQLNTLSFQIIWGPSMYRERHQLSGPDHETLLILRRTLAVHGNTPPCALIRSTEVREEAA